MTVFLIGQALCRQMTLENPSVMSHDSESDSDFAPDQPMLQDSHPQESVSQDSIEADQPQVSHSAGAVR